MTNYANWWTYYRTRMQTMKTATSLAFAVLDEKFRIGYYSINNATGSDFLNIANIDRVGTFLRATRAQWKTFHLQQFPGSH